MLDDWLLNPEIAQFDPDFNQPVTLSCGVALALDQRGLRPDILAPVCRAFWAGGRCQQMLARLTGAISRRERTRFSYVTPLRSTAPIPVLNLDWIGTP